MKIKRKSNNFSLFLFFWFLKKGDTNSQMVYSCYSIKLQISKSICVFISVSFSFFFFYLYIIYKTWQRLHFCFHLCFVVIQFFFCASFHFFFCFSFFFARKKCLWCFVVVGLSVIGFEFAMTTIRIGWDDWFFLFCSSIHAHFERGFDQNQGKIWQLFVSGVSDWMELCACAICVHRCSKCLPTLKKEICWGTPQEAISNKNCCRYCFSK